MTVSPQRAVRVAVLLTVAGVSLSAQSQRAAVDHPRVAEAWAPFLGCWSTSSGGVIGRMVCVVPTDSSPSRVEFMTIDSDSIVSRTTIDASDTPQRVTRSGCRGIESARFSSNGKRLYMHAEYGCQGKPTTRSDALLAMTRPDAFTHVERVTKPSGAEPRVVNFIVQLDTAVCPAAVKRRLTSYRELTVDVATLESVDPLSASDIMDAASELDPLLVQAWLQDRGQFNEFTIRELTVLRVATLEGRAPPVRRFYPKTGGDGIMYLAPVQNSDVLWYNQFYSPGFFGASIQPGGGGYLITPATVGFGVPWVR
ncbi:MAG: hypothetical protein LH616_13580 [Ilumatobacteraceae bacterium]|nr:hypothetical protein [Ilumatobacteraceae bacterium]